MIGFNVLNNGVTCPIVGISSSDEHVVYTAIRKGARLLDSSLTMDQRAIGRAIQRVITENLVRRDDLFIVTKVADIHHDRITQSLDYQLSQLGVEYSDLHIIETPWELEAKNSDTIDVSYKTGSDDLPMFEGGEGIVVKKITKLTDKWAQMEKVYSQGRVKSIGVGNFDKDLIEQLLSFCKVKPAVNMVECNLYLQQPALLDYLREKNIVMQTSSVYVQDIPAEVNNLAAQNKRTANQIIARFLCQKGIQTLIPAKSENEIITVRDLVFSINGTEVNQLEGLDKNERQRYYKVTATVENKYYPKSWTREAGFADAGY